MAKEEVKEQRSSYFTPPYIGALAEEVAKIVVNRLPSYILSRRKKKKKARKIEHPIFLDTSAIIDARIFDVIRLGLFKDTFVIADQILLELKHIADSQDTVKRERGRKGLLMLEEIKKMKKLKLVILNDEDIEKKVKNKEVDEALINMAKTYGARIITCDYNLEKKASIQGVSAVNMNALANCLKITAVPGEALHVKILHQGKDVTQGVGYLDDGTMIVVEKAVDDVGKTIDVVVSRVIQTAAGRILFARKL